MDNLKLANNFLELCFIAESHTKGNALQIYTEYLRLSASILDAFEKKEIWVMLLHIGVFLQYINKKVNNKCLEKLIKTLKNYKK